ncbi:MAG: GNAT family N-acetyltransferase [Proteobacteria bacterium]|nr:GNAT family N-acetyltransferase [Pseudomonadota bacterium]
MTDWRAMTERDLSAVQALADAAHPGLPERPEVLRDKLDHFPDGCLVLARGETVVGYAFAHPWRQGSLPKLDAPLGALPAQPDCLYVHDVVVAPAARGQGAAGACIARLVEVARARDLPALTLVSVYDTWPMWQRHGFRIADRPEMVAVLADYGPSARYMLRPS